MLQEVTVTKTVKVRLLEPNRNKEAALEATLETFIEACTLFVRALEEVKADGSKRKLRRCLNGEIYHRVRDETKLPAVLVQNAADVAIEAYLSYKDKKKHKKASSPNFRRMKSFRVDKRGFNLIDSDNKYRFLISLRLISGRVVIPLEALYEHYPYKMLDELMKDEWSLGSVTIIKKRKRKEWWAHITISKEVGVEIPDDPTPIGIDIGAVNLAVVSTPSAVLFFSGREWWHRRQRWKEIREKLQKERRFRTIKRIGDKERRYNNDLAHKISRAIVEAAKKERNPVIVMEDLTNIRDDMDFSSEQNYKNHGWFFNRLQSFIAYKAIDAGIPVFFVNPAWTSATCPKCGDAHPKNRDRKMHRYKCQYCGYTLNDDLVAARNIARLFKHVASDYMSGVMGCMTQPLRVRPS